MTIRGILSSGLAALAVAALVLTLVGLIPSNSGWIRVLDFPRLLSLIVIGVIAIGCAVVLPRRRWWCAVVLALAAGLQLWRIYPYVAFAPRELSEADTNGRVPEHACFTALGFNVLQHNRDYERTIAMLERERPDVLLLLETDDGWVRALQPVLASYRFSLVRPLDNTYGLVFATRLPVRAARTANITDRDTPTVFATLTTHDGEAFDYVGLHPRPPRPGESTGLRDRKIANAARQSADRKIPAIAMGDFNDVPWSRTTTRFRHVGGYLDPRIGRGTFPSFPARLGPFGWPLDQLFVSPGFAVRALRVLKDVGSDHRPLATKLCLAPIRG